jgi:hypothetical protein
LNKTDARRLLAAVIQRELDYIAHAHMVCADDPSPAAWQEGLSHDWAMGKALQLLAERGVSGKYLTNTDRENFRTDGKTDIDVDRLETALKIEAQAFQHPPSKGPNALDRIKEVTVRGSISEADAALITIEPA